MSRFRQTPRSLVTGSLAAVLISGLILVPILGLSGCSSAELASDQADQSGDGFTGDGDGDGDPTGDPTEAGSDTGSETDGGDGDGDGDGTMPAGVEDPGLELGSCDPAIAQVVSYDLAEAQAEAAAVLVRESVLHGSGEVPSIPLSAQSFLNHFGFDYPPVEGPELQIVGELWEPPMANIDASPRYRLQYAIRGPQMSPDQRTPVDLAIVVDLGPSMAGEPLGLAEEALAALEAALVPGDRVTLIAAGEQPQVLIPSELVEDLGPSVLTGLLAAQSPADVANVAAALGLAYETLAPAWEGQGQPRVLLISNGHFQIDDALVGLVEDHAVNGHYLVSLGLGPPEGLAEMSVRQLATEGRGPVLYDRTGDELWVDLNERFTQHMIAVATDLQVTLSLPSGLAIRDRDQLAAKPGEPELALLGSNDTIIFHHELEACTDLDPAAVVRVEVAWTDPVSQEAKQTVWEQPLGQLGVGSMDIRKGAATVAYARALRGYRDGRPQNQGFGAVLDAVSLIAEALEGQPEDPDLVEMSQVLGKLEY